MQEPTTQATHAAAQPNIIEKMTKTFQAFRHGDFAMGTSDLLQQIIIPAAGGLLGLLAVYFISKLISRRIAAIICRRVDETLGKFIGKIFFYGLMIVASVSILSYVGLPVSGFMAVLATAGFAIGLAFQGTLSNFSAGILLLVFRPFKVGDMVNIASVVGKINEIDIFTTTLDTPDNRRLIIPNSSITSGTIENVSYHPERRVEVLVGVEYGANIENTRAALARAVESMSDLMIAGEDRGYQIILNNLGASSVDWTVRMWVARENFAAAKERLTSQIKISLAEHHIAIPYPQLHLHMSANTLQNVSSHDSRADQPALSIPTIHNSPGMKVRPRLRGENVGDLAR
jgi:small conductance mechanosensitive channel